MTTFSDGHRPVRILVLEDSRFDAELIVEHLHMLDDTPDVVTVADRKGYLEALDGDGFDLILADFSLPGFDGMTALDIANQKSPETPFIFVSGVLGEEIAIDSFKRGATDYVLKQRLLRLPAAVDRALSEARERNERRRAERQRELLVAELSHRVKNMLAAVISITRQTAKRSRTVDEYRDTLMSRLRAMSEAHALVFEKNWSEASLKQVIERTLAPFRPADDDRIRLDGPEVMIEPKTALALTLVFHELVTNAVKHGSLSADQGRVSAEWQMRKADGGTRRVDLVWREEGGPSVVTPEETGFGMQLLQRSVEYELDGKAGVSYPETGLVCELSFSAD